LNLTQSENAPPVLEQSKNETMKSSESSITFKWTAYDTDPNEYFLYLNGKIESEGTWKSDYTHISHYDLRPLWDASNQIWNFTVIVTDLAGNWARGMTIITVIGDYDKIGLILGISILTLVSVFIIVRYQKKSVKP
jgi:hypothetical protein